MHQSHLLLALLASAVSTAVASPALHTPCSPTASWPGWFAIKYAFLFGDSYTTTGFAIDSTQPTISNPLGNPPYPGETSCNGPNWVDYLATKYNSSQLLTYNLACGGATVDSALIPPHYPAVRSLSDQILKQFLPTYADSKWRAANTIFGFFIGINDIEHSYFLGTPGSTLLNAKIFTVYKSLLHSLYASGARNFLILNVPPIDRSPSTASWGDNHQVLEKADVAAFNDATIAMAKALKSEYPKCNVFVVDANKLFGEVLDDPLRFEQTAGYKNTTTHCTAYQFGTPEQDTFYEKCGVRVNEYFWLDGLHPTYPMHDFLAEGVADVLKGGPNVC